MPLTFAHPAAVLPGYRLRNQGVPFAALVIGSMSPDFEYFLRLQPWGNFSHTLPGLVGFCLPVGLVVYGVYRVLILPALPECLPVYLQRRWPAPPTVHGGLWHMGVAAIAILIGALTHIVWDSFTHGIGFAVQAFPQLKTTLLGWPAYKYLQHGSTVVGLFLLLVGIHRLPLTHAQPGRTPGVALYAVFCTIFFLTVGLFYMLVPGQYLGRIVVEIIDAAIIAGLASIGWFRVTSPKRATPHTPSPM